MGRQCPNYDKCFYYQARRRVHNAQILIVNHALFFSDLALRIAGASMLPDYQVVVFDEAHTLEAVAADHLGLGVSSGQVDYVLRRLYNDRSGRGLLVYHRLRDLQDQVNECRERASTLFQGIDQWLSSQTGGNGRVRVPNIVPNPISEGLDVLAKMTRREGEKIDEPEQRQDFTAAANRLEVLAEQIESWRAQQLPDAVYWAESEWSRRRQRIALEAAPIDVGPILRKHLFEQVPTVVMTSATLAVGG